METPILGAILKGTPIFGDPFGQTEDEGTNYTNLIDRFIEQLENAKENGDSDSLVKDPSVAVVTREKSVRISEHLDDF